MSLLKIATWNVNGIRAREAQVLEWVERERPDVVCLQELKSTVAQIPAALCELQGYRCYWHGARAYSGVGLHIRRDAFAEEPRFFHPSFDFETRVVAAQMDDLVVVSAYVPNGGKDFAAKMQFLRDMENYVGEVHVSGARLVFCGDLNIAEASAMCIRKSETPGSSGNGRRRENCSSEFLVTVLWTLDGRLIRITKIFSPGGRRGVACASAISAGGSTTFWPASL